MGRVLAIAVATVAAVLVLGTAKPVEAQWQYRDRYGDRVCSNYHEIRRGGGSRHEIIHCIREIYWDHLGRYPDEEGVRHYMRKYYREGWSMRQIHNDIAFSWEARNRWRN
ncbi:hypothetical protein [Pseudanabaena sp. PCC 6802]|uniref:hypothetical protein n=1 Tax=Pseudanabaena sp. PCC 6802 TaxID=118173 RepID=UPI00036BE5FD|nr:hypothetical protein [Pseudanabaena sp. PCC 6802]